MLRISEIFASIQGEGGRAGEAMVFIRLAGCNLQCSFCDTGYALSGGEEMSEADILAWVQGYDIPWACLTGGEPLIQDIKPLVDLLHENKRLVSVETNGTCFIPPIFDHVTVSPKRGHEVDISAHEMTNEWKYIIEDDSDFDRITQEAGVYLQPVDNNMEIANLCIQKIVQNPGWRLSLQLHKLIGIR